MKKVLIILLFSIIGCKAQSVDINSSKESQTLNTEDEVFYKINVLSTQTQYQDIKIKIREFIWNHWSQQKSGKIKIESYTKEGEKVLTTYELLLTDKNEFIMSVISEREYTERNPKIESYKQKLTDVKKYLVYHIDRIETSRNSSNRIGKIPKEKTLSAKLFLIRLKDINGKLLTEI